MRFWKKVFGRNAAEPAEFAVRQELATRSPKSGNSNSDVDSFEYRGTIFKSGCPVRTVARDSSPGTNKPNETGYPKEVWFDRNGGHTGTILGGRARSVEVRKPGEPIQVAIVRWDQQSWIVHNSGGGRVSLAPFVGSVHADYLEILHGETKPTLTSAPTASTSLARGSLPRSTIKASLYEMEAEFLRSGRVRGLFEACRPAHGPIRIIDFEFENGVKLLNARIEDEFLVTIPTEYASLRVKTVSIPVRERQRELPPMTALRENGTPIF
jgi:hypothetical protein